MELNKEKFLELKGSRKSLASALLKESDRFLFLDIEEIANELETTPSTLSRIVRAIGFNNFKDFRTWVARRSGLIIPEQEPATPGDPALLQAELKGVTELSSPEVLRKINDAAELIARSDSIICCGFGLGATRALVELSCHYFQWTGIPHSVALNSKYDAVVSSHTLGKKTALFLIDLEPPVKEVFELLNTFKDRDIPRISLSAEPLSQTGILCSVVIPCRIDQKRHLFPPLAPFTAALDFLASSIANLKKAETEGNMKLLKKIRQDKAIIPPPP